MKKKNILNRAMFRQVKSPAYGTGISANLVSKEERQRYNYGGRVGLVHGTAPYFAPSRKSTAQQREDEFQNWYSKYQQSDAPIRDFYINPVGGTGAAGEGGEFQDASQWYYTPDEEAKIEFAEKFDTKPFASEYEKIYGKHSIHGKTPKNVVEGQEYLTTDSKTGEDFGWTKYKKPEELSEEEETQLAIQKENIESGASDLGLYTERLEPGGDLYQAKLEGDVTAKIGPMDTETLDTFNIEDVIKKYYDPKKSLGEAQMGLAGQILKAGFQPKKEAAAIIGDAFGKFGTTLGADEKAMKKLAASGEISKEVYEASQRAKGKEQRKTDAANDILKNKDTSPYKKFMGLEKVYEGDTAKAIGRATGQNAPIHLKRDPQTKDLMMPTDAKPGQTFFDREYDVLYVANAQGDLQQVNIKEYVEANFAGSDMKKALAQKNIEIDALIK